jgi:FeS assembly SUF system regulator
MLRISKMTDYAVVLATHLAAVKGPHAARDLAVETQIPEPTTSKLLKKLTRAGVVVSQRGAKGGYSLARSPREIGIHQVIEAIEGPIAVTECSDESSDSFCEYETSCGVRANWQRINLAVQNALSDITLADMAFPGTAELVFLARSGEEAKRLRAADPSSSDVH